MTSQKRLRSETSAAMEPDNRKKQGIVFDTMGTVAFGGRQYDRDEPETHSIPAKDREKLGVNVDSVVFCSYNITPLYPSFFRLEVIHGPLREQLNTVGRPHELSPSPALPSKSAKHHNHVDRLYICETCFKYTPHSDAYLAHASGRCQHVHAPPGRNIYLSPGMPNSPEKTLIKSTDPHAGDPFTVLIRQTTGYALYEIDGDEDKLFCQNLSLFSKLWVESKSVGYDVEGFIFYVLVQMTAPKKSDIAADKFDVKRMTKKKKSSLLEGTATSSTSTLEPPTGNEGDVDEDQIEEDIPNRIVGYFSKEKNSWDNNNLACILVFPPWQFQGLGQLLIEASYYLGEREGRFGGPERPLSESGRKSYEVYWARAVASTLSDLAGQGQKDITIYDVAQQAWIVAEDVIATLKRMSWAEGLLSDGNPDKSQKLVINHTKVADYLASQPSHQRLESRGWLFDDSMDEVGSSEEDEKESDGAGPGSGNEDMDGESDEDEEIDPDELFDEEHVHLND